MVRLSAERAGVSWICKLTRGYRRTHYCNARYQGSETRQTHPWKEEALKALHHALCPLLDSNDQCVLCFPPSPASLGDNEGMRGSFVCGQSIPLPEPAIRPSLWTDSGGERRTCLSGNPGIVQSSSRSSHESSARVLCMAPSHQLQ